MKWKEKIKEVHFVLKYWHCQTLIFSVKQKGEQYTHNPVKHSILINLFDFLMNFPPTNFNKWMGT